jgi:Methyltransferase domain
LGISIGVIEFLIELRTAGYLTPGDAVIEIGAQQLGSTCLLHPDRLQHLGTLCGIHHPLSLPPADPASPFWEGSSQVLDSNAPFVRDFWHWLGFQYAAIDIDGSPGSIPLDLNFDSIPPEHTGKYNLVTNFGTTEHVVNQLNAFKIIHDLTAPNGVMIHEVPAQGMFNHGLVNYNPKFFWLLARSNGYKFIHSDFMASSTYSGLPDNVTEFLNSNNFAPLHPFRDYKVADAGIFVVMQKSFDIAFVPPLDVNTGTPTDNESLRRRYWTVFEPGAFDRLLAARGTGRVESPPVRTTSERRRSLYTWRGGAIMNPLRTLKRLVRNSDATVQGIANQSDLINQRLHAVEAEISSQSDLLGRKLDTLIKIMNELREVHKAQLTMQRSAAEAIKQSANPNS